ncbi:hypothetical protein ACHAWF_014833 [Thalassiosira exigua]
MKTKASTPTSARGKASRGECRIAALLAANVAVMLVLAPTYRRLSLLEASRRSTAHGPMALAPGGAQRQGRENRPAPSVARGGVPFIGEDAFLEKYSSKYSARLPSSKRLSSDPSCGQRPDFFDFFLLPKTERSRFHEDKIIYDLFKNMTISSSSNEESPLPKGTYVELGAFDGKDESNTRFFDECLGWDGLLIEAQSSSYQKVIENRPHAIKMSFSPTCKTEGGTARIYDYPLSNTGMEGLAKSYAGKETVEVPCGPLTDVLRDVFGPEGGVSFFSLDVEGAELMVLNALDLDHLAIEVIMVEIQNTHCPEANCPGVHAIRRHMAMTRKYALFVGFLEASDVYIRWGTEAWKRAIAMQKARKEAMEQDIREHMALQRNKLISDINLEDQ